MRTDEATVTVVMDLVKAFERVSSDTAWRWGLHLGFPKRLLRIVLSYFGFARRLVVGGCT